MDHDRCRSTFQPSSEPWMNRAVGCVTWRALPFTTTIIPCTLSEEGLLQGMYVIDTHVRGCWYGKSRSWFRKIHTRISTLKRSLHGRWETGRWSKLDGPATFNSSIPTYHSKKVEESSQRKSFQEKEQRGKKDFKSVLHLCGFMPRQYAGFATHLFLSVRKTRGLEKSRNPPHSTETEDDFPYITCTTPRHAFQLKSNIPQKP